MTDDGPLGELGSAWQWALDVEPRKRDMKYTLAGILLASVGFLGACLNDHLDTQVLFSFLGVVVMLMGVMDAIERTRTPRPD